MNKYKKILVAMDLEQDVTAIKFAARVSQLTGAKETHFYHVTDEYDLPPNLCSAIEGANESCETIIGRMRRIVEANWNGPARPRLAYDASDGDVLKDVLNYIVKKDIDLVVVKKVCGDSKVPSRLAREATCPVLMVPPGAKTAFGNIFVALDFSRHSENAIKQALAFAKVSGADKITCVHVYSVPIGYHKTGKTYEQFAEILNRNVREQFEELKKKIRPGKIKANLVVEMNQKPYEGIVAIVRARKADILFVGVRGMSKTVAILMGSVTERLVDACNIPMMTVKKKGKGTSLLKALFGD